MNKRSDIIDGLWMLLWGALVFMSFVGLLILLIDDPTSAQIPEHQIEKVKNRLLNPPEHLPKK